MDLCQRLGSKFVPNSALESNRDLKKGFDFIIDEGTPPVRGVIPFNDEHFMLIGYCAKGGVNVELKVRNPQTT